MHNIGTVPTFKMHNVGTVPMFKMHKVGTPNIYDLCLELEFGLYGKTKTTYCVSFLLESSRTYFLSGIHFMDDECTVQKVPFENLFFC